jgi:hypothetical protein
MHHPGDSLIHLERSPNVPTGFDHTEIDMLQDVLKEYLTDLRSEILDTDDYDYRQGLKKKEEILRAILAKLERARVPTIN